MIWTFIKWSLALAATVVAFPIGAIAALFCFSGWAIYSVLTDQPAFEDSALGQDYYGSGANKKM